ncbi:MAG TPA: tetraacyldisaccharide 4'-kinase [Paracoccaceae bacterium]|nr:tetraacyldisaccharide 4'-kinase [Paracoccaceae bacterium]
MRPPAFWFLPPGKPALAARLLAPLAGLASAPPPRRVVRPPSHRAGVPVLCLGNLTVGGSGKTPSAIALMEHVSARGLTGAAFLSRGYGGRLAGPVRVDPLRHSAADVGDEPLLLSAFAPTWVARDRAAGARAAEAAGARAIVMDDGFQNPALARDLSIVVVDAATGFGNGRCLPAGPLREPVAAGLARAQALLLIGNPAERAAFAALWSDLPLPLLEAELRPLPTGMEWAGARVLAFAGIGRPAKFFATLADLGAHVAGAVPLDDHQPLGNALLRRLEAEAAALGAQLVTTEKDAARLPPGWRQRVLTVPVRLAVRDWSPLDAELARIGL